MNNFKTMRNGILLTIGFLSFTACVQDDDYAVPPIVCNQLWEANTDIAAIKALNDTDKPVQITEDLVLEGYVVSNDEAGNFFKTLSIQDKPENPTTGMSIELDMANTYASFPVGSRVLVNAKGLYVAKDRGTYKIGSVYDSNGTDRVGRMSEVDALDKVALSCDEILNIIPTKYTSIAEAKKEANLNTLITLENVQFQSAGNGETYYEEGGKDTFGGATNRTIVDSEGNTLTLRTGSYADFAAEELPDGSGSITLVLSAYSNSNNVTSSTYQAFIRSIEDVHLNNPRIEIVNGKGAIGGNAATYNSCLNVDFADYSAGQSQFSEFINYAYNGSRFWEIKQYKDNNYIQLSAFKSGEVNQTYFIVPVNFDEADQFSFKTKDGYYNGEALKVYYTTNYTINGDLNKSNWVDITSEFTIANGTENGYGDDFTASGDYDLMSLSGNGAIIFAYQGEDGKITTTYQIDDITIVDNDNADCGNSSDDSGNNGGDTTTPPSGDASIFFDGGDFENWDAFLNGLNKYGLKDYATQSQGTGIDGSTSLHIKNDGASGNDYVFTATAKDGLPTSYSKLTFYLKGTSDKSVSINLYDSEGGYYKFNLETLSSNATISPASSNQYTGTIDTKGEWVQVVLDLSNINNLNTTNLSNDLIALKIGKEAKYDLYFDNFTLE